MMKDRKFIVRVQSANVRQFSKNDNNHLIDGPMKSYDMFGATTIPKGGRPDSSKQKKQRIRPNNRPQYFRDTSNSALKEIDEFVSASDGDS